MPAAALVVDPAEDGGTVRQFRPLARSGETAGPKVSFHETCIGEAPSAGRTAPAEVVRGRGRRLPETVERLARRDELLRTARRQFFADASDREAAAQIAAGIARYAGTAWIRERVLAAVPSRHVGKIAELWWTLLRLHDSPPSVGTVRRALRRDHVFS